MLSESALIRRVLALSLLALGLISGTNLIVLPISEQITQMRADQALQQRRFASRETAQAALHELRQEASNLHAGILRAGTTDPIPELEERLQQAASDQNLTLTRFNLSAATPVGGLSRYELKIGLVGPKQEVLAFLNTYGELFPNHYFRDIVLEAKSAQNEQDVEQMVEILAELWAFEPDATESDGS